MEQLTIRVSLNIEESCRLLNIFKQFQDETLQGGTGGGADTAWFQIQEVNIDTNLSALGMMIQFVVVLWPKEMEQNPVVAKIKTELWELLELETSKTI